MPATLNDVLPRACAQGYTVGLFNTVDTDMFEKVSTFTDLCVVGMNSLRARVKNGDDCLLTRSAKKDAIGKAVAEKTNLFGSADKA